jgi:myo-inositol-1-phosphate synthase
MMSKEIRLAVVGVGNCASAIIQGLSYYEQKGGEIGLMRRVLGGYDITDIKPVVAFDIDARKVGKDLNEAIFAPPNNCYRVPDITVKPFGVKVQMGPVEDGVPPHLARFVEVSDAKPVDIVKAIKESKAEVLLNMLPTGSAIAARIYAQAALDAGVAFVNGMPELIVSDAKWAKEFEKRNLPCVGDDTKSQFGGTIMHRALVQCMLDRGIRIKKTYQLNYAGNTDFMNLVFRGESKHLTKKEAVESMIPYKTSVSPGFAFIENMDDRKTTRFYFEISNYSDAPMIVDAKLEVEDSANFAGIVTDAIRCCKLALDRKVGGPLITPSAFYSKHPPKQIPDEEAARMLDEFIEGKRER